MFRSLCEREGLLTEVSIDSAGTAAWHVGKSPDPRAQAAASKRGIDISRQRSRQVNPADFENFDLILAMDEENLAQLRARCPRPHRAKLRLFLEFAPGQDVLEVPDPYYGAAEGFDTVLDLAAAASQGLRESLFDA